MKKLFAATALTLLLILSMIQCHNETGSPSCSDSIQADTTTRIQIINNTDSAVTVYITLGATAGCLQHVSLIPYITDSIGNLVGSFVLGAHDSTVSYAPDLMGLNGNITFGTQPLNCPNTQFPSGTNIFEFIINNSFQAGNPQNTVDISCVAGVNCYIKAYLSGGKIWNASQAFPYVDSLYNSGISSNSGLVGVFPYSCDTCTGRKNPPSCANNDGNKQTQSICNVQRNAIGAGGGLIQIIYLGKN